MNANQRLSKALDQAYVVFSRYGKPSSLDASPLRDAEAILRTLTRTPLRELRGEEIGPYAGWALTTVGNVSNYKHFLPRILEQAVEKGEWMGTAPPIIGERLKMAEWRNWPSSEQEVIVEVFAAAWAQASHEHPDKMIASDWLCGIAVLELDISDALAVWLRPTTTESVLQIADFLLTVPARIVGPHGEDGAYWDYVEDTACWSIGQWLAGRDVTEALVAASAEVSPKDEWRLRAGLDAVALIQLPKAN